MRLRNLVFALIGVGFLVMCSVGLRAKARDSTQVAPDSGETFVPHAASTLVAGQGPSTLKVQRSYAAWAVDLPRSIRHGSYVAKGTLEINPDPGRKG